jgi:hypothetical protein
LPSFNRAFIPVLHTGFVLSTKLAFGGCAILFLAGCGDATEPPPGESPDVALGGFLINLVPSLQGAPAFTSVVGKVYDGATPAATVWNVEGEGNGCRLLVPRIPFCDPRCSDGDVCVADGQCAAYPTAQDLGTVRLEGVGQPISLVAVAHAYQPPASVALPYPPAAEGAVLQINASGGPLGAFTVASKAIAPLASTGSVPLQPGTPLSLTWTPPSQPELSRVEVKLDVSHHGGTKGKIECEVADSGALDIPAAQIGALLALGVSGFPTVTITRVASGTAAVRAGRVSLRVASGVERAVEVPGVVSCTDQAQCPAGQTCQADLRCQ